MLCNEVHMQQNSSDHLHRLCLGWRKAIFIFHFLQCLFRKRRESRERKVEREWGEREREWETDRQKVGLKWAGAQPWLHSYSFSNSFPTFYLLFQPHYSPGSQPQALCFFCHLLATYSRSLQTTADLASLHPCPPRSPSLLLGDALVLTDTGAWVFRKCVLCCVPRARMLVASLSALCSWKSWFSCGVAGNRMTRPWTKTSAWHALTLMDDALNENGSHKPLCLNVLSPVNEQFGKVWPCWRR